MKRTSIFPDSEIIKSIVNKTPSSSEYNEEPFFISNIPRAKKTSAQNDKASKPGNQDRKNKDTENIKTGESSSSGAKVRADVRVGSLSRCVFESLLRASTLSLVSKSYVMSDNIFRLLANVIKHDNLPVQSYLQSGLGDWLSLLIQNSVLYLEQLGKSGRTTLLDRSHEDTMGRRSTRVQLKTEKLKADFQGRSNNEKKQSWFRKVRGFQIEPYTELFSLGMQILKKQGREHSLLKWGQLFSKMTDNSFSEWVYPFLINSQKLLMEKQKENRQQVLISAKKLEKEFRDWILTKRKKKAWQEELKKSKAEEQVVYENDKKCLEVIDQNIRDKILQLRQKIDEDVSTFIDLKVRRNPFYDQLMGYRQRIVGFIQNHQKGTTFFLKWYIEGEYNRIRAMCKVLFWDSDFEWVVARHIWSDINSSKAGTADFYLRIYINQN